MKKAFFILTLLIGVLTFNSCKNNGDINQNTTSSDNNMSQSKQDYKIIYKSYDRNSSAQENEQVLNRLSEDVNLAIKDGYKPIGGINFVQGFITQAMVK